MASSLIDNTPVKFVGYPDGAKTFIKSLGQEVGTFIQPPGGRYPALNYHVPLNKRGPYRPQDLADYDSETSYRTDALGYVLCTGFTKAGEVCSKRAENRSARCRLHGGRIHPLDKLVEDNEKAANNKEGESLSRYRLFQAGQLTVDDLDDEELACCGFRASNGRIYRPRNVPREMAQAFTKAIFDRAQQELKKHTVDAAKTVAEIMLNSTIEPDIRLKAANTLLDRGLGKAPQNVTHTFDVTGFEEVFTEIFSGPRDSRPKIIEGEVVTNDRMFERNEAILAQSVEVKPFEYDLDDKSEEIKKATRKRYASRALGVDLTGPEVPFIRVEIGDGVFIHRDPDELKVKGPQSNSITARKAYTLSDFS